MAGDVTLNGQDYLSTGSYLYRPAGIVHGHQEASRTGGRLIIRTDKALDFNYVREPSSPEEYVLHASADGRPHLLHLKTTDMDWDWQGDGQSGYGRKILSQDRISGATTSLVRLPHGWIGELQMQSDFEWEWFVLSGSVVLDSGAIFSAESYSFRPLAGETQAFVRAERQTNLVLWRH